MALAISMVMVKSDRPLQAAEVQRELAEYLPDLPVTDVKQEEGIVSFGIGESSVILAKMPGPIPWSELEGPCATSILWRNAAAEIQQHTIHWIVTVDGDLNPIELSTLLSQATAATMAAASAMGVYWCNATLIVPRDIFIEFTKRVLPLGPPLDVWVDFRIGKDSDKTSAGFTTGMKALGHMEFEAQQAPEPPGELRQRFQALARYVIENGPVINDGDTVGEDAEELIRVVFSSSKFGHQDQVMRLEYEKASSQKPWWKMW